MGCPSLDRYVEKVTELVGSVRDVEELVTKIAPAKRELLQSRDFIQDRFFEGLDRAPYTRNLLHVDPDDRFSVLAIVWGAQRETPVHDHLSWGVVGALDKGVSVVDYHPPHPETGELVAKERVELEAGTVVEIVPPRTHNIHKMANRNDRPLISIHTYGDPARLCRIYNPSNGQFADRELEYTHTL